ncbi:MAG TPA: hypothetical protein VNO81_07935, partial [Candidatus Nitrosotenuis sp.]|nr:hypothetical protein [Candidatus Nitrosotenuis sp.]
MHSFPFLALRLADVDFEERWDVCLGDYFPGPGPRQDRLRLRAVLARDLPGEMEVLWGPDGAPAYLGGGRLRRCGPPRQTLLEQALEEAVFSPDGERLAFACAGREGRLDLWLAGPDGGGRRRLPMAQRGPTQLAFSPDGRRLAFKNMDSRAMDTWGLYTLDLLSGQVRRHTHGLNEDYPVFTPDGRRLVFCRPGSLHELDLDSGRERPLLLVEDTLWLRHPAFSPDGSRLFFSREDDLLNPEVWVMAA